MSNLIKINFAFNLIKILELNKIIDSNIKLKL